VHVVLAGGSGFLGRALRARLVRDGYQVITFTRRPRAGSTDEVAWQPDGTMGPWASALEGAAAVVNLAGAGIADRRWNDARKRALRDSRVLPTRSLTAAIQAASRPPSLLLQGSAVGYYGPHGDEVVTEDTPPGDDFLSSLCVAWEREADPAAERTRLAWIRTGLVLHPGGGALGVMLTPFKLGVGGRLGTGRQFMPWIHLDDWVSLVLWAIGSTDVDGPFNGTAPKPVTNAEFTRTLARALHRPARVPVPGFALRLLLGEFAESLLTGQRAVPARAEQLGFAFRYRDLNEALRDLCRN
jgi:uncharacterized protein (TIGR01777 family)